MADTFHRLFRIVQLVPRAPKWIDTESIARALANEDIDPRKRTLQRDLVRLERMGIGLVCVDDSTRPYKWSFEQNAKALLVPGLDPQAALALRLVEMHLERLVPRATLRALQPHLQAARTALEGKPVARWLDRVRLIPRSQPLEPPKVPGDVVGVVHEALLEERQIALKYKSAGASEPKELVLHPLGLVHRDSVAYLVATAWHYSDARLYPLHRMSSPRMLDEKARPPAGFQLDAFVAQGQLQFRVGTKDIRLALLMDAGPARVLEETPLTTSQSMTVRDDGRVLVEATLPDTHVLRSFLLGFGAGVEVLGPPELRDAIADAHRAAAARYVDAKAPARKKLDA